ncbi:MAG: TIGR04002 family protein [Clostridia bacterium]|nr:TIGR04002 family protein [Clostridia bacterium]
MPSKRLQRLCLSALFAALIYVFTAFFHIPSHTGYTHIGDAFLFLAACLLPRPYAAAAGASGAVLADCLTGFPLWAPASAVIKALSVLAFSSRTQKVLCTRNALALLPAFLLCIGGYYLYDAMLCGNMVAPLAGIPGYITQCVLSGGLFLIAAVALDKLHIRHHV